MDQPKQRLKRLPDPSGSSAGWWAVQQWPGLVVAQGDEGWGFYFCPQVLWPSQHPVTYQDIEQTERLYRSYRLQTCLFPTRREALQVIKVLSDAAGSS